jgi:hypothetical protein
MAELEQARLLGHDLLLFDMAGFAGTLGPTLTLLASSMRNTRRLYEMEGLP